MILFLDTETTDKIDYRLPVDHPSQPHIVQLAAYLANDDETCDHVASVNAVIKPRGWTISPGAQAVHRLALDYCYAFGEEIEDVLTRVVDLCKQANCAVSVNDPIGDATSQIVSTTTISSLVCHNFDFDYRMLLRDIATSKLSSPRDTIAALSALRPFCTMRSMTNICKLPGRSRGQYKWPKLSEAYEFMFNTLPSPEAAHTAMGDVLTCRSIFVEGRKRAYWK